MAKIDQEVKELKEKVNAISTKVDELKFLMIQVMSKIDNSEGDSSSASPAAGSTVAVDISPLEDRLAQLSEAVVSKADLEPLVGEIKKLNDERMKDAEETIDNVTSLLEKGLALTELTASLKAIEVHLEELVSPEKE